ncbi:hypothetical protein SESBI_11626 [Sesbania bispinosa]|nr:hypothetical protein SESBI_11626 [Sesbania bispinosa]
MELMELIETMELLEFKLPSNHPPNLKLKQIGSRLGAFLGKLHLWRLEVQIINKEYRSRKLLHTEKRGKQRCCKAEERKTSSSTPNPQQTASLTPSQPQSEVVIPRVLDIVAAHMKLMGIIDNITSGQVDNWDEVSRDLSSINVAARPAEESSNSELDMEGTLPSQSSQTKK